MAHLVTSLISCLCLQGGQPASSGQAVTPAYVEAQLMRLAEDYRRDPMLIDVTFGVDVDGNSWTIDSTPAQGGQPARVTVTRGEPRVATWVDMMAGPVFRRIMNGEISAYTASVRARSSEVTLLNHRPPKGLAEADPFPHLQFRNILSHFWVTGQPEIVPFGFEHSKETHGAQVTVLQYADQLRSGWFGILPGQHVNRDPSDQTNPFPSMIIVQRAGTARAKIGGKEFALRDRTMIMVPPGVTHELWNPGDQPAEGFLIMYGVEA